MHGGHCGTTLPELRCLPTITLSMRDVLAGELSFLLWKTAQPSGRSFSAAPQCEPHSSMRDVFAGKLSFLPWKTAQPSGRTFSAGSQCEPQSSLEALDRGYFFAHSDLTPHPFRNPPWPLQAWLCTSAGAATLGGGGVFVQGGAQQQSSQEVVACRQ